MKFSFRVSRFGEPFTLRNIGLGLYLFFFPFLRNSFDLFDLENVSQILVYPIAFSSPRRTVWTAFPFHCQFDIVSSIREILLFCFVRFRRKPDKRRQRSWKSDVTFQRDEKTIPWPLRRKSWPVGNTAFRFIARVSPESPCNSENVTRAAISRFFAVATLVVSRNVAMDGGGSEKSATDRNRYPLIAEFVNAFEKHG